MARSFDFRDPHCRPLWFASLLSLFPTPPASSRIYFLNTSSSTIVMTWLLSSSFYWLSRYFSPHTSSVYYTLHAPLLRSSQSLITMPLGGIPKLEVNKQSKHSIHPSQRQNVVVRGDNYPRPCAQDQVVGNGKFRVGGLYISRYHLRTSGTNQ